MPSNEKLQKEADIYPWDGKPKGCSSEFLLNKIKSASSSAPPFFITYNYLFIKHSLRIYYGLRPVLGKGESETDGQGTASGLTDLKI